MQLDEAGRAELKRNLAALAEGGLSGERVVGRGRRQPVRLGDRLLVARSGRRTGRSRGPQGRSTGLRRSHRLISRVSRHRVWHGHRAHRQRTHRVGCGCSAQRTGSAACGSVRRLSPRCRAAGGAERANRRREHGGRIRGVDDACHGLHELAVEVHLADLQYRCLERLNSPQPPPPNGLGDPDDKVFCRNP